MSILILGGLLALAVVAIGGAVLLGLSEDRAAKRWQADPPPTAPQGAQPWPTTPLPAINIVPPTPVLTRSSGRLPVFDEDNALSTENGQVRQITGELRALTQKAGELEHRLSELSELFERQSLRPSDNSYISASSVEMPSL